MNEEIKISVIIPVYKVEPYLRKCLDSVVNQTYKNLEIILVDDGSPDHCGEICDEYAQKDERISVIHKKNGGLSAARNDGLKIVTGSWISFVDSDDWCELNMYEKAVAKAKETMADIVIFSPYVNSRRTEERVHAFSFEFETEDKQIIAQMQLSALSKKYTPFSNDCKWSQGLPWDKLFKASLILDNGLVFSTNVKANEDVIFDIHAFQFAKKIAFFDDALYHWRMNPTSIGHIYTPNRVEIDRDVHNELISIGKKYNLSPEFFQAVNIKTVGSIVSMGHRCFYSRDRKESWYKKIKYAHESITSEPFFTALKQADLKKLSRGGRILALCRFCPALVLYVITKLQMLIKNGYFDAVVNDSGH